MSQFISVESPEYESPTLLLSDTNKLLNQVGISAKTILSVEELSRVSSSMFVAIFESLFLQRIDGIIRSPKTKSDYELNAQLVVDSLSEQIEMDLKHITGRLIAEGDPRALHNLVHIFLRIVSITSQNEYSVSSIETDESFMSDMQWNRSYHLPKESLERGDSNRMKRHKKPIKSYYRLLTKGESSAANAVYRHSFNQMENEYQSDKKIEIARKRRERLLSLRENRYRANNLHRSLKSQSLRQSRGLEDDRREQKAHLMRKESLDNSMLRKVVDQMKRWRIDEEKESRENSNLLKQQATWHTDVLKTLFNDRLALVREQKEDVTQRIRRQHRETFGIQQQRVLSDLQKRHVQLLDKEQNRLKQSRDHELFRRREAHLHLSLMSSGGNTTGWEESLRSPWISSSSSSPLETRRRRSRSAPPRC